MYLKPLLAFYCSIIKLMERQQQEEEKQHSHSHSDSECVQQPKPHVHLNPPPPPSSSASSPSHEFPFTISLHNKSNSSPPSSNPLTLDLSPADEIFFHGHLLPLHLISHLPTGLVSHSPRASTNSSAGIPLPVPPTNDQNHTINNAKSSIDQNSLQQDRPKSKSFSLFKTSSNWKAEGKSIPNPHDDAGSNFDYKKAKFNAVKRFFKLIKLRPGFLSFWRGNNRDEYFLRQQHQQYSTYSGNLRAATARSSNKMEKRGRKVECSSAPATMKNTPTNSGVLVASGTVSPTKSDSTMEELQAAIQAAIAHCKKSITNEDNRINHPSSL